MRVTVSIKPTLEIKRGGLLNLEVDDPLLISKRREMNRSPDVSDPLFCSSLNARVHSKFLLVSKLSPWVIDFDFQPGRNVSKSWKLVIHGPDCEQWWKQMY